MTDERAPSTRRKPSSLDHGMPGRSAGTEADRRRLYDERRRRECFGRLAPLVTALAGEPASTRSWRVGANGERRVAAALERALGERGIVLHDRRVPGSCGNIDHLAVAPTGVWVVDAKAYRGRVERRDVGGWFSSDVRLFVGRRDRSNALDGVCRQREAVLTVLQHLFLEDAPPLTAAICLVGAEWPWFARPFRLDGTWVAWPRRLGRMMLEQEVLDPERILHVATKLAQRFPVR